MTRIRVRLGSILGVCFFIAFGVRPGPARGADDGPAAYEGRYQQAKQTYTEGRFDEAVNRFRALLADASISGDQRHTRLALIGLAQTFEKLKRDDRAVAAWRAFLSGAEAGRAASSPEWKVRVEVARERVDLLERRLRSTHGILLLTSDPLPERVTVDGAVPDVLGPPSTSRTLYLVPGEHTVRLEADGHQARELKLSISVGEIRAESLVLQKQALVQVAVPTPTADHPAPTPPPVEPSPPLVIEKRVSALRPIWGWVSVGVGTGLLAGGLIANLLAHADRKAMGEIKLTNGYDAARERWNDLNTTRASKEAAAWTLYGIGAAGVLGGATYLLFFADGAPWGAATGAKGTTALGVVPLPGGAFVGATWGW